MKTWFITGASSGLGRALTDKRLQQENRVAATVTPDELKQQYGRQLRVAVMDVTDTAAIRQTVNQAFADLGRIDVIVNNAGYALFWAAEGAGDEQIQQQFAPLLRAPYRLSEPPCRICGRRVSGNYRRRGRPNHGPQLQLLSDYR